MKTVIAHGRPLIRAGLRALFHEHQEGMEISEAKDAESVFGIVEHSQDGDVLLLDLDLPGLDGIDGLRALHARNPDLPIVVVADSDHEADVSMAIENGASGYIPESSSAELFVNAVRLVLSGNIYVPPSAFRKRIAADARPSTARPRQANELTSLTPRQREVLSLIAQGDSNKEMAGKLGIAEGTIRIHVAAILKGLNLRNRTQAALLAVQSSAGGR